MNPRGFFAVHRGDALNQILRDRNLLAVLVGMAARAWWSDAQNLEGLTKGQGLIGDFETFGFKKNERQQYRTALKKAERLGFLTTEPTSSGTVATLVSNSVFSLSIDGANQPPNQQLTNGQPPANQQLTTKNKVTRQQGNNSEDGERFAEWFLTLLPGGFNPPSGWKSNWAECYEKMLRIDHRTKEDIQRVCKWARADPFWQANFMSPAKLRLRKDDVQYFDTFLAKLKQPDATAPKPPPRPSV